MKHKYLEDLIAKYQERADSLSERAKELCGDTSTVSTYKWIHSLAVTYGEFADVLDFLAEEMKPQTNADRIRAMSDEEPGESGGKDD